MPKYTIIDTKDDSKREIECSYEELKVMLSHNPSLKQGLSSPLLVSGVRDFKAPDGFKDHLRRIKQGSGRDNTIKV